MKFVKVVNAKSDICDSCKKDSGYHGVRFISTCGNACLCDTCYAEHVIMWKKEAIAARKAVKAEFEAHMAKCAVALAPIVNHLKATLEVA